MDTKDNTKENNDVKLLLDSELKEYIRILIQPILEKSLCAVFNNNKQLRVYELTDGKMSSREIAKLVGTSQMTISNWWQDWEKLELVKKDGRKYKSLYSLLELMILKNNVDWIFNSLEIKEDKTDE